MTARAIFHRDQAPLCAGQGAAKALEAITREGGDPAFARRKIADHGGAAKGWSSSDAASGV